MNLVIALAVLTAGSWAIGRPGEDLVLVDVSAVDPHGLRFAVEHREDWLTTVVRGITRLGSYRLLIPLVIVAGLAGWAWRRTWRPMLLLAGAYGGAVLLTFLVKALVGRSRPPSALALGSFGGMAFPSGHALQATAVWGMLAVLAAAGAARWWTRVLVWSAGAAVAMAVGASRVYLGAHWLTDVICGWSLGVLWLTALVVAARAVEPTRAHRLPIEVVASGARHPSTSAPLAHRPMANSAAQDDGRDHQIGRPSQTVRRRRSVERRRFL